MTKGFRRGSKGYGQGSSFSLVPPSLPLNLTIRHRRMRPVEHLLKIGARVSSSKRNRKITLPEKPFDWREDIQQ